MSLPLSPLAKRILPLVDLTELAPTCSAADVTALCQKATSSPLAVAAVCVRPEFVALAKNMLKETSIKVATVINFPDATTTLETCSENTDAMAQAAATRAAVAAGADEIDVVFAYAAFQAGNSVGTRACLEAVKAACGTAKLKVILESGAFSDLTKLRSACEMAVDAGADFLKTSTGFNAVGATLPAAQVLCDVSAAFSKQIGIKISGGVRTGEQAQEYMGLVANSLGLNWIAPQNFRFGASKLVDNLLAPQLAPAAGY